MCAFKAPYIPPANVREIVENFRRKYSRAQSIPTDILDLVELDLNLELIPMSGLRENFDIDALLLGDRSGIWIDDKVFSDPSFQNRLRFSVAHEIGHLVLHEDLYNEAQKKYQDKDGWKQFLNEIPSKEYFWIEQQAYEFAGRLLVPIDCLRDNYREIIDNIEQTNGVDLSNLDNETLIDYLAIPLSKIFGVSQDVMIRRLQKEAVK